MAQQVCGCKRGRLLEVVHDFTRLLLIGATGADCPRRPPQPGTPSDDSCMFCTLSCAVTAATYLCSGKIPNSTHASKMHALYLPHENSLLRNSQRWPAGVAAVGAARVLGQSVAAAQNSGSRARSSATEGKRPRLQPYTCCAIAHQVARRPGGGSPRRRSGRRAPAPAQSPPTLPLTLEPPPPTPAPSTTFTPRKCDESYSLLILLFSGGRSSSAPRGHPRPAGRSAGQNAGPR